LRTHIAFPEVLDISGQGDALYDLVSVAVHLGELRSGHYVAYTKKEDGMWYLMDDTRVSRVSKAEVLQQEAYILTYQKR
jgi:ubiquitin carboxyl-terminal hydrolase 22/27/51